MSLARLLLLVPLASLGCSEGAKDGSADDSSDPGVYGLTVHPSVGGQGTSLEVELTASNSFFDYEGTASADFGGTKNAGLVTGIIDGFVYLGTATQAFLFARILPKGEEAKDPAHWIQWPGAMVPVAVVGLGLCLLVWNARPKPGGGGH